MPSSASRYSGNDSQRKSMPSWSAVPGMSSTPSISSIRNDSLAGAHRREADAAVAHHERGDAVPGRGREQRIPGDLPVVVGVHVHPAGRDDWPRASSSRRPRSATLPTATMRPASIATSPVEALAAGAVYDRSAADHEVVHGASFARRRVAGAPREGGSDGNARRARRHRDGRGERDRRRDGEARGARGRARRARRPPGRGRRGARQGDPRGRRAGALRAHRRDARRRRGGARGARGLRVRRAPLGVEQRRGRRRRLRRAWWTRTSSPGSARSRCASPASSTA